MKEHGFVIMGDFNAEFQPSVYVAFLFQTDVSAIPDDHMVQDIDAKDLQTMNLQSCHLPELCG
jgi:DNA-binding transcriptional regulator of glucitol operon